MENENDNRARSITVGTAFGGVTEVMMRNNKGEVIWCLLQPVEVVEFIHQLSANIGCHINIIPRKDFAAWRDWRYNSEELAWSRGDQHFQGVGWAPHPKLSQENWENATKLAAPEEQAGFNLLKVEPEKNKQRRKRKELTKE